MKKANKLRQMITKHCDYLKTNPEKLHVFIDNGKVMMTNATSLSFEYQYTLNIIITDYNDNIDTIIVPIIAFLYIHQQESFGNDELREDALTYEVDALDNHSFDISINIKLTERVLTLHDDKTGYKVKHCDDKPFGEFIPDWAKSILKDDENGGL